MGFFTADASSVSARAELSDDRLYRYVLERVWDINLPVVAWVMLNPSTADARVDDATIRACCRFARRWGYGGIRVVNLFAWRARDPLQLGLVPHPVSEPGDPDRNDRTIRRVLEGAGLVILAWGNDGNHLDRDMDVLSMLDGVPLCHLGLTKTGQPGHPLFLPADRKPLLLPRWRRTSRVEA